MMNDREERQPFKSEVAPEENTHIVAEAEGHGDELPLRMMSFMAYRESLWLISKSAIPSGLSFILGYMVIFINVAYMKQEGNSLYVEAIHVGHYWVSLVGYVVNQSLNNGLNVLCAQASGAGDHKLVGFFYHRGVIISLVVNVLQLPLIIFAGDLLKLTSFDESRAQAAATYARLMIPSVVLYGVFDATKNYLNALGEFWIPFIIQAVTLTIHYFSCGILVNEFQLGLKGPAISKNLCDLFNAALIILYLFSRKQRPESWFGFTRASFSGLGEYLKYVVPIALSLYFDFMITEGLLLLSGLLGSSEQLNAHVGISNTISIIYLFASGASLCVSTLVGTAVGEGQKNKVRNLAFVGFTFVVMTAIAEMFFFFFCRAALAKAFTDDDVTEFYLERLYNIIVFIILPSNMQQTIEAVLKVLGKANVVVSLYIFILGGFSLPLAYHLGLNQRMGVQGIWTAFISCIIVVNIFSFLILAFLDWGEEIAAIRNRLRKDQSFKTE
eukprot:TRINITY_DN4365_c0_g3_i1.p1 TRINITY_DN4365_c0_g3~~TRINITY_DN4365_c0_g3_i1.p1  ORF type:complete len:498 (-),score=113.79 TRINITY_DN4365_c0_g3_i1:239-1732(-)